MSEPGFIVHRNLGGYVAKVTVSERHRDRLTITRHPVELGAAITDHAYKEPAELTVVAGWVNDEGGTDIEEVYQSLLALQLNRTPFQVVTGKRTYENMLFESLSVDTDEKTEYALLVTAECREIILVETTTSNTGQGSSSQTQNQKDGGNTGSTQQQGTQSLGNGQNYNNQSGRSSGILFDVPGSIIN